MTKVPTAETPIRMDPALESALEDLLEPYEGEELELAQMAVREVYESDVQGSFGELMDAYREAVEEAVGE